MFTDAVVDLVEAGVITGARKERNRGKIVTAFMMGTQRLYDFVDDNPMVEMRPVDFTNDTHVIRSFSRMIAINSAIEIDLTGQVVADSIGHADVQRASAARWTSSAAQLWPPRAGRSSRCPSTAAGGAASRIVPSLQEGAGVVDDPRSRANRRHRVGRRGAVREEHRASGRRPSSGSPIRTIARSSPPRHESAA